MIMQSGFVKFSENAAPGLWTINLIHNVIFKYYIILVLNHDVMP